MPDFFENACKELPRTDAIYGICDLPNDKAFTTTENKNQWIATVENKNALEVTFTAIDKCLFADDEFPGRGRCDGMLTTDQHLYFVELKDRKSKGHANKEALEQLESTVKFLYEFNPQEVKKFRYKKVFACNRKKPHFAVVDSERQRKFYDTYKFRIDTQAKIVVV